MRQTRDFKKSEEQIAKERNQKNVESILKMKYEEEIKKLADKREKEQASMNMEDLQKTEKK